MPWPADPESRRRSSAVYGHDWRKARAECLRRAGGQCQIRAPGICTGTATEVDHIVAVADGGGHEQSNLRATCRPCHAARTAQQGGGYRRKGPKADPPCQPRTNWADVRRQAGSQTVTDRLVGWAGGVHTAAPSGVAGMKARDTFLQVQRAGPDEGRPQ